MTAARHTGPDARRPEARYSNYVEIGHNAFEVVLDFGQLYNSAERTIHSRIVMGPAYAKELLSTLERCLAQYEQDFGPIREQ